MFFRIKILSSFLLFLLSKSLYAQVEIVAEQDQDRNLTLISFNKSEIPYTVKIEFLQLDNLESLEGNILFKVAEPGKTNLLKLQSIYINEKTGFRYNTKLFKGNLEIFDPSITSYLVPLEPGTIVSMRPLTVQNTRIGDYVGVGFFFETPAFICAPRKGIISEIKMDQESISSDPVDLESENFIEIYHPDGTFSRLSGPKLNSAKVAVGETVFPGQVIAESSNQANEANHHVKMIQSRWEMTEKGVIWVNFPVPVFSDQKEIQSNETLDVLKSIHPIELISKEMDKKELKKFLSK
jgi:hypothetical protein